MKKERLKEIIDTLLKKDETVETAGLLNEVLEGFDDTAQQEVETLTTKYAELEKKYIDTFKGKLDGTGTPKPSKTKEEEKEKETSFNDIFIKEDKNNGK